MRRLERLLARPGVERNLVVGLLAAGFVERIVWLFLAPIRLASNKSEMWHVAAHFATTGVLADAYGPGSGISSHVGPFNTMVEGYIYRLLGVGSLPAELTLAVIAAVVVTTLFFLLYRVAAEIGISAVPRVAALAALALVPLNFWVEVVDFRIREGAFAAAIATGVLLWILRLDRRGTPLGTMTLALLGLAAGFAFLISPGVALGIYPLIGLIALRRLASARWPAAAVILVAGFALTNGAWIARNERVYHQFVPSRGNFGLELALANFPGAADAASPGRAWHARLAEVHPFFSAEALARLKSYPNDLSYFKALQAVTNAWIGAHPAEFARLTARHLGELYFPPAWIVDLYDTGVGHMAIRLAWLWGVTALALIALVVGLVERSRQYLFVAITIAGPTLLYCVVQPTLRYRYAFAGLLTFLAADLAWRLIARRGRAAARAV